MRLVMKKASIIWAMLLVLACLTCNVTDSMAATRRRTTKAKAPSTKTQAQTTKTQAQTQTGTESSQNQEPSEPRWLWNVLVFPPESGWEAEPGRSIKTVLEWHTAQISESGRGASGHDIQFVQLPPVDEVSARTVSVPIKQSTIAVMSFAGEITNRVLIERFAGNALPLMLAGGESNLIDYENGGPIPNLFALDMYRDYRCETFARYADKILPNKDIRVALAATRFTVDQEREAKICSAMLSDLGFMPLPYWTDSTVSYAFGMMTQEIQSASDGVLITFLGDMGAKEMWRGFMRVKSRWQLWNCTHPDDSWLSCTNMTFADQNFLLPEHGGFSELSRRLWATRVMRIADEVAGGRADALIEWLIRGIADHAPAPVDYMVHQKLLYALARVHGIPFGNQKLDISPETHRPRSRLASIIQVRNHKFDIRETFMVDGLRYVPSY